MKRIAAGARNKTSAPKRRSPDPAPRRRARANPPQLLLANRQTSVRVDTALLRKITRRLLAEFPGLERCEMGIQLVGDNEMTSVNETFLQHFGTTDVITFDHRSGPSNAVIYGELFICADEAVRQARRFKTSWQEELVRYLVHGVLHLRGFDDRTPALRRRLKREENRLLQLLSKSFPLRKLQRTVHSAHD